MITQAQSCDLDKLDHQREHFWKHMLCDGGWVAHMHKRSRFAAKEDEDRNTAPAAQTPDCGGSDGSAGTWGGNMDSEILLDLSVWSEAWSRSVIMMGVGGLGTSPN